jgi:Helicase conserved C-terminal domain
VVGVPTTRAELAAAAGPALAPERLDAGLAALAELGVALPGRDGRIVGPPGLAAPFGRPGGLGPSVAELAKVGLSRERLERVAARLGATARGGPLGDAAPSKAALAGSVAAALADPDVVAKLLADADDAARRLLDQALATPGPITVLGVGYGRFAGYPDAEPATWLLERGLLLPVSYNQFAVPREAALGLRGGLVFPDWPPPPALDPLGPLPEAPALAAAAATRAVVAAEGVCTRLDRAPLELVRTGTVAVRDLRRLAGELSLPADELALLLDLLVEVGVLAVGGPFDRRSLALRPEADAWLAGGRVRRWADLARAWRDTELAVEDHLAARHRPAPDGAEGARPLAGRRFGAAPVRRAGLLAALAGLEPGAGADPDALAAWIAWRQPMAWPWPPPGTSASAGHPAVPLARVVLDAACFLGLAVAAGGRVAAGLPAGALAAGPEADGLARALPEGSGRFLVAGDLTVVAPGGLAPAVEAALAGMADREPASGAASWRVSEASLRRAFDEGAAPEELLAFLRDHSDTPLPQALEYLVADTARRHGRLRVGQATSYLRGDPALVAAAVRSPAGRRLGLRELGPGVAVSDRPEGALLAALRRAGEAPLAEEADGRPRPEGRRPVRHVPRPTGGEPAPPREPPADGGPPAAADPGAVVARLRGAR